GTTYTTASLSGGTWYVHYGLRDAAGNLATTDLGPYYVDSLSDCTTRHVSVLVDGTIDIVSHEWRASDSLLDYDGRSGSLAQALYATWDTAAFYLGWHGATWDAAGTLWAYLGTAAGGSTSPAVAGQSALFSNGTLPFVATYAIEID